MDTYINSTSALMILIGIAVALAIIHAIIALYKAKLYKRIGAKLKATAKIGFMDDRFAPSFINKGVSIKKAEKIINTHRKKLEKKYGGSVVKSKLNKMFRKPLFEKQFLLDEFEEFSEWFFSSSKRTKRFIEDAQKSKSASRELYINFANSLYLAPEKRKVYEHAIDDHLASVLTLHAHNKLMQKKIVS